MAASPAGAAPLSVTQMGRCTPMPVRRVVIMQISACQCIRIYLTQVWLHAHILRREMGGRGVAADCVFLNDTVGPIEFGSKMCFRSNIYCLLHRLQQEIQQNMEKCFFIILSVNINISSAPCDSSD